MTVPNPSWPHVAAFPVLLPHQIHVWCASVRMPTSYARQLAETLSPDERMRADQFCFDRDRDRFIVCRGLLRVILAHYLGTEPGRLQFCCGARGKPALSDSSGGDGLRFNLSHSHKLALFAVAREREIGIDLERVRPIPAVEQLVERILSARERPLFRALPPSQKQAFFFKCWTRKEAYVKACGDGLMRPLDRIDVSLTPGISLGLLSIDGSSQEASRWSLHDLMPAAGYVAALVVEGHGWQLACWQWPAVLRSAQHP